MTIKINSENQNHKKKIELKKMEKIARAVLRLLGKKDTEVNISFITSQKIRVMNRRYFGIDAATDVIAFPAGKAITSGHGSRVTGQEFLGDIAISTDRAKCNSRIYGMLFKEEVALYVIHGLLHLAGYEDTTKKKKEAMKAKEDEFFRKTQKTL